MNRNKLFVVLYFILNLLATLLLTNSTLNPNIVPFNKSFLSIFSSVIGNLSILLILYVIGTMLFKISKNLYKYLVVITLFLNACLVLLIYFTRSFKTMLSFYNLTLFRNPDAGFANQIILDGVLGAITSWQILCFFPFLVLLIYLFFIKNSVTNIKFTKKMIILIFALLLSFLSVSIYQKRLEKEWPFKSATPDFGVHYCGVYNYYFAEVVLRMDYNKSYYKNIDDNINLVEFQKIQNSLDGILEGMNLFLIQAESLQNFTISFNDGELTPNLNKLLEDENAFYFSNVHNVVGLGNTSDAEFVVNTGYYPVGDLTIAWEAYDKLFEIQNLANSFGEKYISYSYNPTIEGFYGHKYVHEKLYSFKEFKGFESFNQVYPYKNNKDLYLSEKWVSDEAILDLALLDAVNVLNEAKNFYIFLETISPHYPFSLLSSKYPNYNYGEIDLKFNNYLNQIAYIDKVLYDFIMKAQQLLDNTVFIIYGDHGNTLSKKSYEEVFNQKISQFDYRKLLLEIPAIIYDPSGKINHYIVNKTLDKSYILHRTLSQLDLNSTINILFNLKTENLLGVNMFSNEVSFAIDPKSLDFITDNFFYSYKTHSYKLYSDIKYEQMIMDIEKMKKFKIANDNFLMKKIMS